jgi:hydrogenase maturation protein HypF
MVEGVVQGVGFRPFVHRLASRHGLNGWVYNSTNGVEIVVEGFPEAIEDFLTDMVSQSPPLADIRRRKVVYHRPLGLTHFAVKESKKAGQPSVLIPCDISVCDLCLKEMGDPGDRRYQYPFINCTDCGPRFTIIDGLPYDRPATSMRQFTMCPSCLKEYEDINSRRYHAQPNACPACGPSIWLVDPKERPMGGDSLAETRLLLAHGNIVAIRGLGGFHLACYAENEEAVQRLRARKSREAKPLAIMVPDLATVKRYCVLDRQAAQLLATLQRPIVLIRKKVGSSIAPSVAPNNALLGVMLPYTPLHHLLFSEEGSPGALVMTSGNLSDEPIIADNRHALFKLSGIADAFLLHDRPIVSPCDDSVMAVHKSGPIPVRRARGYVPSAIRLPLDAGLTRGSEAVLSQHMGDLKGQEAFENYCREVVRFQKLLGIKPQAIAYDLHPDYLSSRYAREILEAESSLLPVAVQHHHAHIASCMAENGLEGPVIGVAADGAGLGSDGKVWGCEFMIADYDSYQRMGHLMEVRLAGGDRAALEPYRTSLSWLYAIYGRGAAEQEVVRRWDGKKVTILLEMLQKGTNSPWTSSLGRLFDAANALMGLRQMVSFEGQAAMELESLASVDVTGGYAYTIEDSHGTAIIDPRPMLKGMIRDLASRLPREVVAARFHNTAAEFIARLCHRLSKAAGLREVVLSGGCFQNRFLVNRLCHRLAREDLKFYLHHQVPPNDGGLSLGQAIIAGRALRQCA